MSHPWIMYPATPLKAAMVIKRLEVPTAVVPGMSKKSMSIGIIMDPPPIPKHPERNETPKPMRVALIKKRLSSCVGRGSVAWNRKT